MKGYGQRLRSLRGRRTSVEVAKALKISDSSLRMYESEERVPRDEVKIALAKYYGTTVDDIFFRQKCHK